MSLVLSLLFLLSPVAQADFDSEYKLSAFAATMPEMKKSGVDANQAGLLADISLRYKFDSHLQTQWSFVTRTNPSSRDAVEKFFIDVGEAQLTYKVGSQRWVFGYHYQAWEGTDLINPMDMVFVKNARDPLNMSSRSAPGVFLSDSSGVMSWDLFFIPEQRKSLLPGPRSPWWPRYMNLPVYSESVTLLLPDDVTYDIRRDEVLNNALKSNVALRFQFHLEGLDLSVAGFDGSAQTPILDPTLRASIVESFPGRQVLQLQNPVEITPYYYRVRTVGGAAAWTLGSWILRAATQHTQPIGESVLLPGWSDLSVLGFERTWSWRRSDITFIFQGVFSQRQQGQGLSMLSSLLEKAVMGGFRWAWNEKLVWFGAIFQEQKNKSFFVHQDWKWNHNDNWSSQLALDLFNGSEDSSLGVYKKNTQISYSLNYKF